MANTTLDKDMFFRRLKRIYKAWNEPTEETESLRNVDSIVVCAGMDEEIFYSKTTAFQRWMVGYELNDMIFVLNKQSVQVLTNKRKVEFLKPLQSQKENQLPPIELLARDKTDMDKANYAKLIEAIQASNNGKVIGQFAKDRYTNAFVVEFYNALKSANFESVDVSSAFAFIMAEKEDSEVEIIKKACNVTTEVFNRYLKEEITEIIDSDKKVKHTKLSEGIEKALSDRKYIKNLNPENLDSCYPPIVQSGGNYQLKFSTNSDKNNLHFGSIICAFGARYKQYCSNIVRTLMVNPSEKLQAQYEFLVQLEEAVLDRLRPGARFCDVYAHAVSLIEKEHKELLDKFTKNVGFVTGLEFREGSLVFTAKNPAIVKKGMVINVAVGFSDLKSDTTSDDAASRVHALFIGDTVVVVGDGPAELLTNSKKRLKNVSLFIRDEEEDEDEEEIEKDDLLKDEQILGRGRRNNAILESKLRTEQSAEEKRKQHQKELSAKLNEAARARLTQKSGSAKPEKAKKSTISYKSANQMPNEREIKDMKIFVDKKYETLILPIFGMPVPFHISTIKNLSLSVENEHTYLRINFFTPITVLSKAEMAMYGSPEATFLKEITYRSTNKKEPGELGQPPSSNLSAAFRLVKDVQKKFKTREAEEKEMDGIVKQDSLILSNNKGNPKLKDLYIRPNLYSKRISGTLEAHVNGFRFTSIRGDKVDLLYNNIKHAFFQPCDNEMIILIHFTLKNAIMFGKKKHLDVQFYTEVGEITTDLGKHQHMHDRDDLAAEQAERELRQRLKTAFESFCEKVDAMTTMGVDHIEFEGLFRDLAFHGVPYRSNALLQPTAGCLVNLTDWPPFVITLDEVECVHFERVQFHLKNFDMVFVFKDYSRKVVNINAIPMQQLDSIKEWLNSCDIRYTEGIQSLNWTKIMKTIVEKPEQFFDDGGWTFLDPESGDENEDDEEEDEEDEKYCPTDSDGSESDSESDFSGSDVTESDSYSEEELGTSEESGKDWSELEEEARQADREDDFEQDSSRKHKGGVGKAGTDRNRGLPPKSSSKHSPEKSKNGKRRHDESPKGKSTMKKFKK